MIDLNSEIKFLPGTGPARAEKLFKETGIADCEDLVYFFPYKYIDRSKFYTVREINSDIAFIQLKGIISEFKTEGVKYKQRLTAKFTDPTGTLQLIWFQGADWVKKIFGFGQRIYHFRQTYPFQQFLLHCASRHRRSSEKAKVFPFGILSSIFFHRRP